ncbi:MAG: hypothetical protein K2N38_00765 [Oscillospiraceae bacterium]|nr:hypothetical protein [Oscillospiraceae bacterium]
MNKLFKKAAALIVGAAMVISQFGAVPFSTAMPAWAAAAGDNAEEQKTAKPEVLDYEITDSEGKTLNSISANKEFNITIKVIDRLLKRTDVSHEDDILFTKSMGRFKCEDTRIAITPADTAPLQYTFTV